MEIERSEISGAWVIKFPVFADDRGIFREWFKRDEIKSETGIDFEVRQANQSTSRLGVVRGIHYSLADNPQHKLVTCTSGRIVDFVVDIRPNSKTFRKSISVELMPTNGTAVLIEHGLGHAFISLEEGSTISYLLTSNYSPNEEYAINPLDKELGIDWRDTTLTISDKDKLAFSIDEMLQIGKLPE